MDNKEMIVDALSNVGQSMQLLTNHITLRADRAMMEASLELVAEAREIYPELPPVFPSDFDLDVHYANESELTLEERQNTSWNTVDEIEEETFRLSGAVNSLIPLGLSLDATRAARKAVIDVLNDVSEAFPTIPPSFITADDIDELAAGTISADALALRMMDRAAAYKTDVLDQN